MISHDRRVVLLASENGFTFYPSDFSRYGYPMRWDAAFIAADRQNQRNAGYEFSGDLIGPEHFNELERADIPPVDEGEIPPESRDEIPF